MFALQRTEKKKEKERSGAVLGVCHVEGSNQIPSSNQHQTFLVSNIDV